MSLVNLPTEALAHISARLSHTSRISLSLSHPSLTEQFSPTNTALWHDLSTLRNPPPLKHPPPFPTTPLQSILLHDLVHDYLLHKSLPYTPLHRPLNHPPFISASSTHFYTAAFHTFLHHSPTPIHSLHIPPPASLSSTSQYAILGLQNGATHLYNPRTRTLSRPLKAHKAAVTSSLLLDETLVTGSADRTIRLRHVHTRRTLAVLRGHDAAVRWLAPIEGGFVSHAGSDGRVKFWDVNRALCVSTGRPGGVVSHCEARHGVVYVGGRTSVSVLDLRMGMDRTAAVLSLPRGRGWVGAEIGCMALGDDGRLVAGVGGGGVAVWEARGGWEARGLGWPRRWAEREGGGLKAVLLMERSVVVGGGGRELLTFGLDGRFEGVVVEDGARRGPVSALVAIEEGIVVGRSDGRVDLARTKDGVPDWERAREILNGRKKGRKFWEDDDDIWEERTETGRKLRRLPER